VFDVQEIYLETKINEIFFERLIFLQNKGGSIYFKVSELMCKIGACRDELNQVVS
jgi:hypothetical protein